MTVVTTSHIALDERGIAYLEGTRTRVAMVIMDKLGGLSPEEIRAAYGYLSLAQIYAALAYYYDHQAEMDSEIAREAKEIAQSRKQAILTGSQPGRAELEQRMANRGTGS